MNHHASSFDYTQALCAQTDPELFFPEAGGANLEAKKICEACDVKAECLIEALTKGYTDGIWGGLSPKERRKLQGPVKATRGRPKGVQIVHKRSL